MATLTEFLISIITLIAAWFIGNKSVWGQRIGLLANPAWWFYVLVFKRYGFIPMEIAFTVMQIRNLIKWEHERSR
jgi:hypothetical protein